jgi:hypothetical protein
MTERCDFQARILFDETIEQIDVFVWELEPLKGDSRAYREWVEEHLQSWQLEDYQDNFNDPCDGPFEVVFKGTIKGFEVAPYSEWDEEVIIHDHLIQPLPENWLR